MGVGPAGDFDMDQQPANALIDTHGAIVTISSVLTAVGIPGLAMYAATKGGIDSLARNLASEFASVGIRVNTSSPGDIQTDMLYEGGEDFDDYADAYAQAYPLGRIGQPEDVAYAALYLVLCPQTFAWVARVHHLDSLHRKATFYPRLNAAVEPPREALVTHEEALLYHLLQWKVSGDEQERCFQWHYPTQVSPLPPSTYETGLSTR